MTSNNSMATFRAEDPLTMVIFGGTGDLTRRKLLPGIFTMYLEGLLPKKFAIVCHGRRDYDDSTFRPIMEEEIRTYCRLKMDEKKLKKFMGFIFYYKGDLTSGEDFKEFKTLCDSRDDWPDNKVFYLSIAPSFFGSTVDYLKKAGLITKPQDKVWTRLVVEKPFGTDLASAQNLNNELLRLVDESQVYRIDHYLGKETVQNIISFRFANTIFEPVFNSQYVDHIQITAAESVGMESGRGAYYDTSGALRDMMQNHLLQLLCLVCMEPPSGFASDAIRNEKVKVLQSIRPPKSIHDSVIRAQYGAGLMKDEAVPAYIQEDRVPAETNTATYVAAKFFVENWRWAGVPMYLRTGKRMKHKRTAISVQFKKPPLDLFRTVQCEGDVCDLTATSPNVLTFHISPYEGVSLQFAAKRPSMQLVVESQQLDFNFNDQFEGSLPEAYERLLLDVMRGDSTLFTRSDEVEAAWKIVDPILSGWENDPKIPVHIYQPGTWGPHEADTLFENPDQTWYDPKALT